MASEAKRVEIGFSGGQVLVARLGEEPLKALRSAVEQQGEGWQDLETEDGTIAVDLAQVVFVRAAGSPHEIGFSGA